MRARDAFTWGLAAGILLTVLVATICVCNPLAGFAP